ncbi:hypothetical protein BGX28_002725 [Mortierella sp. GBA30]|nr:hypothetical protein BGX28_002725 [Mortierella sp. GBA30]
MPSTDCQELDQNFSSKREAVFIPTSNPIHYIPLRSLLSLIVILKQTIEQETSISDSKSLRMAAVSSSLWASRIPVGGSLCLAQSSRSRQFSSPFSTSATPLSRCWRTASDTRSRTHKHRDKQKHELLSIKTTKIKAKAKKAIFTDYSATVSGTGTATSAAGTSTSTGTARNADQVTGRVIPLKKNHNSNRTDRNDHDAAHYAGQHNKRSNHSRTHNHSHENHHHHNGHNERASRLRYEDFLPPRHHRQHYLHRLRLMQMFRQQQMYQQHQQAHSQAHGQSRGPSQQQQQQQQHHYGGGYNPWGTHWGNPYWNPWMLHLLESKRKAARSFLLGIVVTGGAFGIYNGKKEQWKQWPTFLGDTLEVKSMLLNAAGSSMSSFRSISTATVQSVPVGNTVHSETSTSQGLHAEQKKLKMLTPEQVEQRLAQHQRSFRVADQGNIRGEKRRKQNLVQGYSVNQLPSNNPIEDDLSRHAVRNEDGGIDSMFFGVFDGHSGWCCSQKVARELAPSVAKELNSIRNPKDTNAVADAIERGFLKLDHRIVHDSAQRVLEHPSRPLACSSLLPAISGSCALMAYIDVSEKDLYVACAGDSRAVMGVMETKEDGGHVWRAVPLSFDQTGRNPWEVKRLQGEHPGEEDTVVRRGRVLGGLEPTRAFGDARYKWTKEIQEKVFSLFPAFRQPRPNYKTPPYVTAKPVVRHHKLLPGDRFLVMATDGLWDKLTSDEVVQLVGNLLDGKVGHEEMFLDRDEIQRYRKQLKARQAAMHSESTSSDVLAPKNTETTHISLEQQEEEEEELTPPNLRPKGPASQIRKFTYRDHAHASTHLIRNALGGADDDKVAATLSIPSPISRAYRDDITVTVIFFGQQDTYIALSDAQESDGLEDIP